MVLAGESKGRVDARANPVWTARKHEFLSLLLGVKICYTVPDRILRLDYLSVREVHGLGQAGLFLRLALLGPKLAELLANGLLLAIGRIEQPLCRLLIVSVLTAAALRV